MKYLRWNIALAALGFLLAPFSANAQSNDESDIKSRMIERLNAVDAIKTKGLVGENNKGFLEQRGALSASETGVMNAENADRRALYSSLAGRLGLTVAVVGQGRAEDLRNKSAKGVWLQNPNGQWYEK